MKTRCPCCGASASLEVLITHDEARNLMVALAGISDELAKAALRYLGLFRPGERDLSWTRAAKLLGELVPLIQAGEITRKRQSYPAPREAWVWAFNRVIEARDSGKLTPPLTSHGFLLENLTFWTPDKTAGAALAPAADTALSGSLNPQQQTAPSSTIRAAAAGEKFKR